MPNREKKERNEKIWEFYHDKGFRYQSIANMFKMKIGAVSMVISRMKKRKVEANGDG